MFPRSSLLLASLLGLALAPLSQAHDPQAVQEMAGAAKNFLAALTPEQKGKAALPFETEERKNWHFIPRERKGLAFREMDFSQRLLAQALMTTGLSARGFQKAATIMSLDEILRVLEGGRGPVRDSENYFFSLFGEPAAAGTWGWRVEGHHLSFNFTMAKGEITSVTPAFLGSNPGEVKDGPRQGLRVLGQEEELAWQLVRSLDEEQKKVAIIADKAPRDVLNDPKRTDFTKPEGIGHERLKPEQQKLLAELIHEYLRNHQLDVAADNWRRIEQAGLAKVSFCWAGSTESGQPHYYRVQGPTFVLELDNTQNNANHVHALFRDLEHDFGTDPLGQHLKEAHDAK